MAKKRLSIQDVLAMEYVVDVDADTEMLLRPLSLVEMLHVFTEFQDPFITLYSQSQIPGGQMDFGVFIVSAPTMVARIIAMSTDAAGDPQEEGYNEKLEKETSRVVRKMAGTLQLLALENIWRISVPDPKKLEELLSGVMVQLKRLSTERLKMMLPKESLQPITSPTNSPVELNSSLQTGTT